jgi:tRNA threonylcarbamoyladenosine biosynthesis protein TsaE
VPAELTPARAGHGVDFETASAEETERAGARLAALLRPGDVVAVAGDLGAGKTTFVRGACRRLGVEGPVSSPTFTIGHRYDAPTPVAHLDLYRVRGLGPEEWGDLEPYFDGTIAFVEWPEHAGAWLPPVRAAVSLEHVDESHRRIRIDGTGIENEDGSGV